MKKKKYVELPLTDGGATKVDADVEPLLAGRVLSGALRSGYVTLWDGGRRTFLHRKIAGAHAGCVVDHINGDVRDNRRSNLRLTSQSLNNINRFALCKNRKYRYRGVWLDKRWGTWSARVGPTGSPFLNRRFKSEIVAALAVDDVLRRSVRYPGRLNFPERIKRENLGGFLKATRGRIFSVVFARRSDGAERHMICRTGVMKELKGGGMLFDPDQRDLLGVYDLQKREYRFIPLENVLCVSCNKTRYAISA